MCGLNGIFAYNAAAGAPNRLELVATRDHMAARGPDGAGEWWSEDKRLGLGHRRLAIIDLSERASQPMTSACGRYVIVFNGEIYNYPDLRQELEAQGCLFRTTSDTETLLHLYARDGGDMVHRLRGMFAFAIWDSDARTICLARDPYGIKPLYYSDTAGTFRFASQVKALIGGGGIDDARDPAGIVGFYLFGSVPEPLTTYHYIKAIPAGHVIYIDAAGPSTPRAYHSIAAVYAQVDSRAGQSGPPRLKSVREALLDSVRHHLVADVPVGAFLSAGIDSSALVGLMRDAGQSEIETVTLSFSEFEGSADDESPIAAQVARTYGTRHTTRVVTKDEFHADLPRILDAMDQPTIDGVNTWFVAKAARERGLKVAISGVGGDELFGGYPAFRDIPRWVGWLKAPTSVPGLGRLVRQIMIAIGPARMNLSPKTAGLVEYGGSYPGAWFLRRGLFMPWELTDALDADVMREGLAQMDPLAVVQAVIDPLPRDGFARVATMEAALYMRNQLLRDTDWASMAHSLEVRTPLVDATLLSRVAAMGSPEPGAPTKVELASAPSVPLPAAVTSRKKTGFGTPLARWMPDAAGSLASNSTYSYGRPWARHVLQHQLSASAPSSVPAELLCAT